jgi:hypothetical protein
MNISEALSELQTLQNVAVMPSKVVGRYAVERRLPNPGAKRTSGRTRVPPYADDNELLTTAREGGLNPRSASRGRARL